MNELLVFPIVMATIWISILIFALACNTSFFNKLGDVLKTWLSPKVMLPTFIVAFLGWQIHKLVKAYEVHQANILVAYEKLSSKE